MKRIDLQELWSGLCYARHILFHPFDGFWDMKFEKRGNMKAATVYILLFVLTLVLKGQFTGFIFTSIHAEKTNLLYQITGVLLPLFLFCLANWCITTLFDGEGSFPYIVMTVAYASVPYTLIELPLMVVSNVLTGQERAFYQIFDVGAILWGGLLLFCGLLTLHRFGIAKTLLSTLCTVLGMIVMLFLVLMFLSMLDQIINFLKILWSELQIRQSGYD